MKIRILNIFLMMGCLLIPGEILLAQSSVGAFPDSIFSLYYHQRQSHFDMLPGEKGDIVFVGNSITDGAEWSELFHNASIRNRGISGDFSAGILNRLDKILENTPSKIFLMIGINDLGRGTSVDSIFQNIRAIAVRCKASSPYTNLYIQSLLPVNPSFGKFAGQTSKTKEISALNQKLNQSAEALGYTFINLHPHFCNDKGYLDTRFTNDGLHVNGHAYQLWKHLIFSYVNDAGNIPDLIPQPRNVKWTTGRFPMYACHTIQIQDSGLNRFGTAIASLLASEKINIVTDTGSLKNLPVIRLALGEVESKINSAEAYSIQVTDSIIILKANTTHGLHNGIQTLKQLMRDEAFVNNCEITDWPAFGWRGYMIDAGRNYVPVALLKQQIDVLSAYKLNVFHFHATEDIAWRIAIERFPQLTAPENMLRNKGLYYSREEILDLITYCKERYITFLPELDMPGHSDAFKRAIRYDMQSDSGLAMVKEILHELCRTYPVPYIHIGADEVKISNPSFIPEVTALIESYGKKVIGWQPGGNFSRGTIRQLWMDDNARISGKDNIQVIDSRHLYLNHMDPFEAITTLFNRQVGDTVEQTSTLLGATLCLWHDRAIAQPDDLLAMNPVYPSILAFAERSWIGGGQKGWIANISDGNEKDFINFESRLLSHKKLSFSGLPFPYVKHSHVRWKMFGPFPNEGNPANVFQPELPGWDGETAKTALEVTGATIVLRHWWAPLIKGAIPGPAENTTWYAATKIWSPAESQAQVWIGFNNLSRSTASDSPPAGEWDGKGSQVWINGAIIQPPRWKRAGQKGHNEIPLVDEDYFYRQPTNISLKKGWNHVLIKLPVGSFKGSNWQNPVKWMFTFAPLDF